MKYLAAMVLFCAAAAARADDYVVVVFDTSGSMDTYMKAAKSSRMTVAQTALSLALAQVPETTKIGVLSFNGWVCDLGPVNRERLRAAIFSCRAGGGTPLYAYIKAGADRLLQERRKQLNVGYYKLLVVTDGEAGDSSLNEDGKFPDGSFKPGVLKDIIGRGIVVDAIGLEMSQDHALKTLINGTYMRGDDPASIQQSISKAVAEVGFSGNDGLSEQAFRTVSELPEPFVRASLQGLTELQNQPIGEPPSQGAAGAASGGGSWLATVGIWFLTLGLVVVTVVVAIIAFGIRSLGR